MRVAGVLCIALLSFCLDGVCLSPHEQRALRYFAADMLSFLSPSR